MGVLGYSGMVMDKDVETPHPRSHAHGPSAKSETTAKV